MAPPRSERKQHALEMFEQLPAPLRRARPRPSASSRTRAGAGRRSRRSGRGREDRVLDVACGTGLVSAGAGRALGLPRRRARPERGDARPGPADGRRRPAPRRADRAGRGRGRAPALRRRRVRPPHLHLPAALRRRPGGDAARAGPGGEARRARLQPRVLPAARDLAAGSGASTRGSACRLLGRLDSRGWFEAGRFLGPSIEGFYRAYPLRAAGRALASGRDRRGRRCGG